MSNETSNTQNGATTMLGAYMPVSDITMLCVTGGHAAMDLVNSKIHNAGLAFAAPDIKVPNSTGVQSAMGVDSPILT